VAVQELSAFFVTVAGQLIVGAAEPVTVTTKWQTPPLSAELTVTVVCPTGKNVPDAGEVDNAPHSPDASAEPKVTIAPDTPLCVVLAVRVMSLGQVSEHAAGGEPPGSTTAASAELSAS